MPTIRAISICALVAVGAAVLADIGAADAAGTPQQQCRAAKNKAAGKYYSCRSNAEAKLAVSGDGAKYAAAIAQCAAKITSAWQKAEDKALAAGGNCLDGAGTATTFQAVLDENSSSVSSALGGGGFTPCATEKRVFLSSTVQDANLGGLAGADAICQGRADAAGLGGTYKAWLSDSTTSVAVRFAHASVPYRLVDGTLVANDWADLTDGFLTNNIVVNEYGVTAGPTYIAWSATKADGTALGGDYCNDWTSNSTGLLGGQGAATFSGSVWSVTLSGLCSTMDRLYCIEQ